MHDVESEKIECPKEQMKSSRKLSGTLMAFLTRLIGEILSALRNSRDRWSDDMITLR